MNIQSHWKLASFICKSSEINIKGLKKIFFAVGNIFPDISFTFVKRPHIPSIMYDTIMHRINKTIHLSDKESHLNYFSIGIITHYLADFFCAAHTEPFGENARMHYLYEQRLEYHVNQSYNLINNMHVFDQDEDLIEMIGISHMEYLKNTFSYDKDIHFITKICMLCVLRYQNHLLAIQDELPLTDSVVRII